MQYQFLNIFLDKNGLLTPPKEKAEIEASPINPILFENNVSQIEKLYDFYKSNINIMYINGFLGTGKAQIANYSLSFLSNEAVILKYNCFNSTVLDDILLSFYVEFRKLSQQGTISEPKVRTENFTQKVNSYFTQVSKPFVIIIDSFESILNENKQEILDFISHLSSLSKVKIIIIGRTFESKNFEGIEVERVSTYAMDKPVFEKYLRDEKIKSSSAIIDELYKHTRGYYFFTALAVKIIKKENLSLVDFLIKFKESFATFPDFIGRKALSLVPPTDKNLFWFLTLIRTPLSNDLLKKLGLYDENKIDNLIKNSLAVTDNNTIYVHDFIKEQIDETSAPAVFQKIRQYIIDLYLTQLPLKPLERDISISRQTMRQEIEYHSHFLPKKPKNLDKPIDINYLSYAQGLEFENKTKINEDIISSSSNKSKTQIDLTQRKNASLNLENISYQDRTNSKQNTENPIGDKRQLTTKELVQEIKRAELNYRYSQIIELASEFFAEKNDSNYQNYLPLVYSKLAHAYQKLAKYEEALKYYNLAQEEYTKTGKSTKANYTKLNIARVLYETYKLDIAKNILEEIVNLEQNPSILKAKAYILLANLEETLANPNAAFAYYQKAIDFSQQSETSQESSDSVDTATLSELYFKFALALDDKNDIKSAAIYYKKCIGISEENYSNKFLSSAYSNLATLHLERGDNERAVQNFQKALDVDAKNKNDEGIYFNATKLAEINKRNSPEKALEFLYLALESAKKTNDIFYIVSASLAIGDHYYDKNKSEYALKNYIYALDCAKATFSRENLEKINTRINDIKFKIGVEKFENIVNTLRETEHE